MSWTGGDTPPQGFEAVRGAEAPARAPDGRRPPNYLWLAPLCLVVGLVAGFGIHAATTSSEDSGADKELADARERIRTERAAAVDEFKRVKEQTSATRGERVVEQARISKARVKLKRLQRQIDGAQAQVAKTTIPGDGTFVVGEDIEPGSYRADAQPGCYWARLGSLDTSDINDNDNADGPVAVQILPSDKAFQTTDCAEFHKAGP